MFKNDQNRKSIRTVFRTVSEIHIYHKSIYFIHISDIEIGRNERTINNTVGRDMELCAAIRRTQQWYRDPIRNIIRQSVPVAYRESFYHDRWSMFDDRSIRMAPNRDRFLNEQTHICLLAFRHSRKLPLIIRINHFWYYSRQLYLKYIVVRKIYSNYCIFVAILKIKVCLHE